LCVTRSLPYLETVLPQKLGPTCVAAYNAYAMCADLPKVAFLAMDARHLVGTGVPAAATWLSRRSLAGFPALKIVASSGFGPAKCRMMAAANAPIDVIGTGSYLPELWSETYATADIIAYDGVPMVKAGREFLLRQRKDQ
jgi:hypothetical protein